MSGYKDTALKESCFRPGSSLCPGCMESIAFQNIGRVTDNGVKTVFTIGTSCAEVSTLAYPNIVAWGRGDAPPESFEKAFMILHNVFESAPTLGEAIRDVSDILTEVGALDRPVQVVSVSGDGGAISIGMRALLHTIQRRARNTMVVLVNEIFANTGFQYSPTSMPFADTSTTPVNGGSVGNTQMPLDYIHLCIAAGVDFVAQVSPAHGKLFVKTMERALAAKGMSIVFVPAPCISGWKFDDGETIDLAMLGATSGVFPAFTWERGKGGRVLDCDRESSQRTPVEEFLGRQRRFAHIVEIDVESGTWRAKPGREDTLEQLRAWVQSNVDRLYALAEMR